MSGAGVIVGLDIGNSRIKWARWQGGRPVDQGALPARESALDDWLEAQRAQASPRQVVAVCVGEKTLARRLSDGVRDAWSLPVDFFRTSEVYQGRRRLLHGYRHVERHGADRWAALIAAAEEFDGPLCVLGAGTALTVDLLDADGRHRGGSILPSVESIVDAVLRRAAGIEMKAEPKALDFDHRPPERFAVDTRAAITGGAWHLLRSGLEDICREAAGLLGADTRFIVTGGQAERLRKMLPQYRLLHRPLLVLQGVYHALANEQTE